MSEDIGMQIKRMVLDLKELTAKLEKLAFNHALAETGAYRRYLATEVSRYIDHTGSDAWKMFDIDGYVIRFRQGHRAMLEKAGLWGELNAMPVGELWQADIRIALEWDGEFMRPVDVHPGGWVCDYDYATEVAENVSQAD